MVVPVCCVILISIISVFIGNGVIPIPQDAQYFVSSLGVYHYQDPHITAVYKMLYSPIYHLLGFVYLDAKLFIITTYVCVVAMMLAVYILFYRLSRNTVLSFLGFLVALPITPLILTKVLTALHLGIISSSLNDLIVIIYPIHFGWITTFTVRTLTGILFVAMIYCFVKEKYVFLGVSLLCALLVHPNNGVTLSLVCILAMVYQILFNDAPRKYLVLVVILSLFGLLPSLAHLVALQGLGTAALPHAQWYELMSKINPDNFSGLYYFHHRMIGQILALLIPFLLSIYLWMRFDLNKSEKGLAVLCVIPPCIFLFACAIELVVKYAHIGLFTSFIITSQLGLKSCELSFIPLLALFISCYSRKHYGAA